MKITSDLITSILTQSEAITCKNLRIVEGDPECNGDIIIRFEDDIDTTISIYYTPVIDLLAIGTINSSGAYRNLMRFQNVSRLDPRTLCEYLTFVLCTLEIKHEVDTEEV